MDIPVQLPGAEGQNVALRIAGAFTPAKLTLNGQPLAKENGFFRLRSNAGSTIAVKFKGRFLDPIPNLVVGAQTIQLTPPLQWYQYAWISIPLVLVFMGGAVGGMCAGLAAGIGCRVFRTDHSEGMKYALTGLISLGAFAAYYAIAGAILGAIRR